MSMIFNADEIFEMALTIERNGANYYRHAAELATEQSAKSTLLELAAMEDEHYQTFSDMRAKLTAEERQQMTYDPEGELPLYLRALADKNVFNLKSDPSQTLTQAKNIADILRFAIGMEKDSIVFYLGLQEMTPERVGGARLKQIVKEEMSHIATLGDLLRCVQ